MCVHTLILNIYWLLITSLKTHISFIHFIILICKHLGFTYVLDTEFSDGVVHQYSDILQCHSDISVYPAAFFRPVLKTFLLLRKSQQWGGYFSCLYIAQILFLPLRLYSCIYSVCVCIDNFIFDVCISQSNFIFDVCISQSNSKAITVTFSDSDSQ